jgi:hypothetical protein
MLIADSERSAKYAIKDKVPSQFSKYTLYLVPSDAFFVTVHST